MGEPYYHDDDVTLYLGDAAEILPMLPIADLILTDPPYSERTHSMARSNKKRKSGKMGGRSLSGGGVGKFDSIDEEKLRSILTMCRDHTTSWMVSMMDYHHAFEIEANPVEGFRMMRIGVWVKTDPMPQISADRPGMGWEAIAYLHRDDVKPSWYGGGKHGNYILPTVKGQNHPTSKPLSMMKDMIQRFTMPGDLVIDPFAGSGTMLRASKDLGRRAIGIEISEERCEQIVGRLRQSVLALEGMELKDG